MSQLDVDTWKRFVPEQLATGGLGPHLRMMSEIARASFASSGDRAWFLGCYIGPYVPTTGYEVWRAFPSPDYDRADMFQFLHDNVAGLPVRGGDRRGVSKRANLAAFYDSYSRWLQHGGLLRHADTAPYTSYFVACEKVLEYAGRFTIIKLLEGLHQAGVISAQLDDGIWPAGAQSGPRKALQQLAESAGIECDLASSDNSPAKCAEVNRAARWAETLLEGVPPLTWFQLEGMLCDARQAVKGRYPGRALDEDLAYALQCQAALDCSLGWFYDWRRSLFPASSLGELGGWTGKRPDKEKEWTRDALPAAG